MPIKIGNTPRPKRMFSEKPETAQSTPDPIPQAMPALAGIASGVAAASQPEKHQETLGDFMNKNSAVNGNGEPDFAGTRIYNQYKVNARKEQSAEQEQPDFMATLTEYPEAFGDQAEQMKEKFAAQMPQDDFFKKVSTGFADDIAKMGSAAREEHIAMQGRAEALARQSLEKRLSNPLETYFASDRILEMEKEKIFNAMQNEKTAMEEEESINTQAEEIARNKLNKAFGDDPDKNKNNPFYQSTLQDETEKAKESLREEMNIKKQLDKVEINPETIEDEFRSVVALAARMHPDTSSFEVALKMLKADQEDNIKSREKSAAMNDIGFKGFTPPGVKLPTGIARGSAREDISVYQENIDRIDRVMKFQGIKNLKSNEKPTLFQQLSPKNLFKGASRFVLQLSEVSPVEAVARPISNFILKQFGKNDAELQAQKEAYDSFVREAMELTKPKEEEGKIASFLNYMGEWLVPGGLGGKIAKAKNVTALSTKMFSSPFWQTVTANGIGDLITTAGYDLAKIPGGDLEEVKSEIGTDLMFDVIGNIVFGGIGKGFDNFKKSLAKNGIPEKGIEEIVNRVKPQAQGIVDPFRESGMFLEGRTLGLKDMDDLHKKMFQEKRLTDKSNPKTNVKTSKLIPDPEELTKAVNKIDKKYGLTAYKPEEYKDMKRFLDDSGSVGSAVKKDGDIVSVFNTGGEKGAGKDAVIAAINNGGKKLDFFEHPKLRKLYEKLGFEEVKKMPWDDKYAPEGWDFTKSGRPDIVFMELNPQKYEQFKTTNPEAIKSSLRRMGGGVSEGRNGNVGRGNTGVGSDGINPKQATGAESALPTLPEGIQKQLEEAPDIPTGREFTDTTAAPDKAQSQIRDIPQQEIPEDIATISRQKQESISKLQLEPNTPSVAKSLESSSLAKNTDPTLMPKEPVSQMEIPKEKAVSLETSEQVRKKLEDALPERRRELEKILTGQVETDLTPRTLSRISAMPAKMQEPIRIAFNKAQEKIDQFVEKGFVSDNKYIRGAAHSINSIFGGVGMTKNRSDIRNALKGEMSIANHDANMFQSSLYKMLEPDKPGFKGNLSKIKAKTLSVLDIKQSGDIKDSLRKVWAVMDEEAAGKTGDMTSVKDLTPKEKEALDMLRGVNDMIHETNFVNGFIDYDTYIKNKNKYMGRAYKTYEMPDELSDFYKTQAKIETDIYKKRKSNADLSEWQSEQIIKDPVYITSKRLAQTMTNVAVRDYTEKVVKNLPHMVSDVAKPGFEKLSNSKAFGALADKFVSTNLAQDIKGFFFTNDTINKLYDGIKAYDRWKPRQAMKQMLTVFNPLVQAGNYTSNNAFAFMAGIDPISLQKNIPDAFKEIKGNGPLYRKLIREDILGTDYARTDLAKKLKQVQVLEEKKLSAKNVMKGLLDIPRKSYGAADDLNKMSAYITLQRQGFSDKQAIELVRDGFQNYANVGKIYDVASKTPIIGNAFVKFQADLQRIIKNGVKNRPLHTLGFLMSLKVISDVSSALSGESAEDREIREGRFFFAKIPLTNVPLQWQTPVGEINIARYISPYYVYTSPEQDTLGEAVARFAPFQWQSLDRSSHPNGKLAAEIGASVQDPVLGPLVQLFVNSDFRGKPILDPYSSIYKKSTLTKSEKLKNATHFLLRAYSPQSGKDAVDLVHAIKGEKDYYGRTKTPGQAIARMFGIRIEQFGKEEVKDEVAKNLEFARYEYEDITTDIKNIYKDVARNKIDNKTAENRLADPMEKLAQLTSKMTKLTNNANRLDIKVDELSKVEIDELRQETIVREKTKLLKENYKIEGSIDDNWTKIDKMKDNEKKIFLYSYSSSTQRRYKSHLLKNNAAKEDIDLVTNSIDIKREEENLDKEKEKTKESASASDTAIQKVAIREIGKMRADPAYKEELFNKLRNNPTPEAKQLIAAIKNELQK